MTSVKRLVLIQKRLNEYAEDCPGMRNRRATLALKYLVGGGSGTLRFYDNDDAEGKALILGHMDGNFNGGDGATNPDKDGFLRGE